MHPNPDKRVSVPLTGTPFAVAISPAREAYVTQVHAAAANRVDLPSTSFSAPFDVGPLPSQVRISPDGETAYIGNQDARTVTFVRVGLEAVFATMAVPGSSTLPGGSILTLGLSPDGERLYALTDYAGVYVINAINRTIADRIPAEAVGKILTGVAFHPFSPCMYVAARDEGTVATIDLQTNEVVRTWAVAGGRIQNLAVSHDGATLFATDIERSKLIAWDLATYEDEYEELSIGTQVPRNAFDVAITPDNTQIYVSTLADGIVYILDLATLEPVDMVNTGGSPRYIAFDRSGESAVIPNEFGWVNFIGVVARSR